MSELRHDPLSKRWVIIANERSRRPEDFADAAERAARRAASARSVPEARTRRRGRSRAIRPGGGAANGPGWEVRVIPNKYPALSIEGTLDRQGVGLYDRMRGVGAHEVIIESPQHDLHMGDMEPRGARGRARPVPGAHARSRPRREVQVRAALQEPRDGRRGDARATRTCSSSRRR